MSGPPPAETDAPEGRWHYRRSLASRVTLLTTIAVGLSVALLSSGVYVTARAQLQAQLDDSLRSRANKLAVYNTLGGSGKATPYALWLSPRRRGPRRRRRRRVGSTRHRPTSVLLRMRAALARRRLLRPRR